MEAAAVAPVEAEAAATKVGAVPAASSGRGHGYWRRTMQQLPDSKKLPRRYPEASLVVGEMGRPSVETSGWMTKNCFHPVVAEIVGFLRLLKVLCEF